MAHRPVELIVTNAVYDVLDFIEQQPAASLARASAEDFAQSVARQMLIALGNLAHPTLVLRMLAEAGGPATFDEIHRRVCAAQEAMRALPPRREKPPL